MSEMIDQVIASLPIYKQCYSEEPVVIVIDRRQVIHFETASFYKIDIPVGTPLSAMAGTVVVQALERGERVMEERDASRFGVAYISTASPIVEEGEVIGAIGFVTPNSRVDTLRQGATDLSGVIEQMAATTQEMTSSATQISDRITEQVDESVILVERLNKAHSVLAMVKEVAEQSHLLGLNAAIEAARAGEHGLGFNVVATEIRKMAEYSKNAVSQISEQFRLMEANITAMNKVIGEIAVVAHGYSASMQELNSAFDHITDVSQKLLDSASV